MTPTLHDTALGSLLGALVGDAAGATLEFLGFPPSDGMATNAMTMPGGGYWDVAPGQITDDGELTLSLARALSGRSEFDIEAVARSYAEWFPARAVRYRQHDLSVNRLH